MFLGEVINSFWFHSVDPNSLANPYWNQGPFWLNAIRRWSQLLSDLHRHWRTKQYTTTYCTHTHIHTHAHARTHSHRPKQGTSDMEGGGSDKGQQTFAPFFEKNGNMEIKFNCLCFELRNLTKWKHLWTQNSLLT